MRSKWTFPTVVALAVLVPLALAFAGQEGGEEGAQAPGGEASEAAADTTIQPIAFPHDIHAGEYRIECQYCHYSAGRSVDAGMPPVATCMGCHQVVGGSANPDEIAALREYAQEGEAIPWVRIYKVSDHVRFPHMRHVNAGVDCQSCHGEVQEMGVVEEVHQPLEMGWCVSCHRDQGAATDCAVCHY